VTVKGVVMGTMAVAVDVVVTAVVPVVHAIDFIVVVEPYATVVVVTVAKSEVVSVVVEKTGTTIVELMAIVTPEMVVLEPGMDGVVLVEAPVMSDADDTPGELNGGFKTATEVVVMATTVVCTEVVPYAETVDVSVTGTVVVTVAITISEEAVEGEGGAAVVVVEATQTVDGAAVVVVTVTTVVYVCDDPNAPVDVAVSVTGTVEVTDTVTTV
jgi:hypothetical protein